MGTGNESEKWENRELETKLLIGLSFKFGFVPAFSFPVLVSGS